MQIRFERQIRSDRYSWVGVLFTIMVLFVPTSSFYVYYSSLFFGVVLLAWDSHGEFPWRAQFVYIHIFLLSLIFFLCLYRWIYFYSSEDLKEFLKLLLFLSVLFFGVRLRMRSLENIFSFFVVLNCVFSLLQYLGIYGFGVREITEIYNARHHVEASLSYSIPRALGLSPGPGQQSVIGLFFFSYFLVLYFFGGGGFRRAVLCLVALSGIALSQSKTAIIAIALGSTLVFLLFLSHASYKRKISVLFFFFFVSSCIWFFKDQIMTLFPEYFRLMEQGGDVSSLQSRLGNWVQMLDVFNYENSLFLYLFGVGRAGLESYGVNDLPYDSDYIYILVNYGAFGLVSFLMVVGYFILRGIFLFSRESVYGKILVVSLIYAVISAIALNYFFEPRILILFAVVLFNYSSLYRGEVV